MDKKIFSSYRCDPATSISGHGIYLIERLKDNSSGIYYEKHIIECLGLYEKRIKGYKDAVSLYHINSILFFLLGIENTLPDNRELDSIRKHLRKNLKLVFKDKIFDDADLYIFKRMLDEIDSRQKTGWHSVLSLQIPELSGGFDIETMIRISWQEMLYFGDSKLKELTLDDISHFIDSKQESLALKDFLLVRGLVGLGNMVLSSNAEVG